MHGTPSAFEYVGIIGTFEHVHDLLFDDEDRNAGTPDFLHQQEYLFDQHGRQTQGRLVQHQEAGTGHQASADRAHLLLAAGQSDRYLFAAFCEFRQ